MARSVPEWKGVNDDSPVPARVRLRIFDRCGGRCHLSGRLIRAGEFWELDHIVALCNGGTHSEYNLAPVLRESHRIKTKEDVAEKALVAKKRKSFLGIRGKKKRKMGYRTFSGKVVKPRWE